jgi:hypothetical protein
MKTHASDEPWQLEQLGLLGPRYAVIRVPPDTETGSEWIGSSDLWNERGDLLGSAVRRTQISNQLPNVAAASVFLLGYVNRLAAPVIAAYLCCGYLVDAAPERTAIQVGPHPIAIGWYDANPLFPGDSERPYARLLDHVKYACQRAHARYGLGMRTAWGDAAAAFAETFQRIFEWHIQQGYDTAAVEQSAAELLAAPAIPTWKTGKLLVLPTLSGPRMRFARSTCCFVYKGPSASFCDACTIRPLSERVESWRAAR